MDEETRQALADAGKAYKEAPAQLRRAVLAAADKGEKPARIHEAIGYVWTYDYVARLVREHRGPSKPGTRRK
ncbi:MAG: hypothetical protein J2P30_00345, partial [Actinobacteria bacterium]|nr:hypothetical protein [Actinomycetota bacterium]